MVGIFVAVVSGVVAVLCALSPHSLRPYLIGAGAVSGFWYIALTVVVMTGTGTYLLGADGERWTSDALRKLTRHGWQLIEHVPLEREDIDHVLIGPGGAFAVETKNTSGRWELNKPDQRVTDAAAQARRCAERLRVLLMEHSVRLRADVQPLVVLWGPANADRATVHGVQVVRGSALAEWKGSLGDAVFSADQVQAASDWLARYVARRDAAIEKDRGRLPSLIEVGPLALLARFHTASVGFLAALIAMVGALKLVGDGFVIPVMLLSLLVGAVAFRHRRARYLAIGWLAASGGSFVALVGWVVLTWIDLV